MRKVFCVGFGCKPLAVTSQTRFAVYRRQPRDENRIYAVAEHHVGKTLDFGSDDGTSNEGSRRARAISATQVAGGLLQLALDNRFFYEDALGRLSRQQCSSWGCLHNNFGGWHGTLHEDSDAFLQISLKRVRGVLSGPKLYDEHDGIQVSTAYGSTGMLMRAAFDGQTTDASKILDMTIDADSRWTLDTLLAVRKGFDEKRCRQERREFADPPRVVVETIVLPSLKGLTP